MNSDMSGFWGNLIGPIVGTVIGAIITGVGFYIRGGKANRVVVRRISQTPQVNISKLVSKKLEIRYKGILVNNIVLNTLLIMNRGRDIISPFKATINMWPIEGKSDLLEILIDDPVDKSTLLYLPPIEGNEVQGCTLDREYLNPIRAYKEDKILLNIISNAELDFSVKGGGKGWGVVYKEIPKRDYTKRDYPSCVIFLVTIILVILLLVYIILSSSSPPG